MSPDTATRSDLVEITCRKRADREKSIAVFAGEIEKGPSGRDREKWAWLPKSQIEYDDRAGVATMPEWLAKEKGLI